MSAPEGGLARTVDRLSEFYGLLPSPPSGPFAFAVWEILGAYTSPKRRDAAFGAMRRARALTPDAVMRTPQARLVAATAQAGPYGEQRLQAIRTVADLFRRSPTMPDVIQGPLRAARRALKSLPVLGPAGVHRLLLFTTDHAVLPADPSVLRVARRVGYASASPDAGAPAPRRIQQALARELGRSDLGQRRRVFLYLSHHAAVTCTERDPHCAVCPLSGECEEGRLLRRG